MGPESIRERLRQQPFEPFEVRLSNGDVHRIGHPELAWMAGNRLYIYYPEKDRVVNASLLHVVSTEYQQNKDS
jgi:hypothetical protein